MPTYKQYQDKAGTTQTGHTRTSSPLSNKGYVQNTLREYEIDPTHFRSLLGGNH